MKQRITYLLSEGNRVDPKSIEVSNDALNFTRANEAAEEWRVTLGWEELPVEIQTILTGCHELRLRWSAPKSTTFFPPVVARLPAGLHAFFTPIAAELDAPVCNLIHKILGCQSAKCHSVAESWTKPPILSERFASTPTFQFYQYSTLQWHLGQTFLTYICAKKSGGLGDCSPILDELADADYIDVDFDTISHAVVLTAYWSHSATNGISRVAKRRARSIRKLQTNDRIEVGVLSPEAAKEPEEISLGGYLTVIGENDHPGITLFSFPARHHSLPSTSPATFKATFQTPTGLHPKLDITLSRQHLQPPKPTCGLHAYLTLPSALFIDKYQFSDPLFLSSQNLIRLHSLAGEQDLEAPDWVIGSWGSAALVELATPAPGTKPRSKGTDLDWVVTIPTHLRYLSGEQNGTKSSDQVRLEVPWPAVFWACEAEEGLKMATNPFDRVNLGYDGLFGPKTMFYHVPPALNTSSTVAQIKVPILDVRKAGWVPMGTLIAVAMGFTWVCWQLLMGTVGGRKHSKEQDKNGKKKQ